MLGAQVTLPREIKSLKLHKGQVLITVIVLLALVGVGGWWSYQSGLLSQWLPAAEPVMAAAGEIVIEQVQPATSPANVAAPTANVQAAAQATSTADETTVVAATPPAA